MVYLALFLASIVLSGIMTYAAAMLYEHFPESDDEDIEEKED